MKTIFDQETRIGLCTSEPGVDGSYHHALSIPWPMYVQTIATVNASTLTLTIAHECYLELEGYRIRQPWINEHRFSHTIFSSEEAMTEWATDLHKQFIVKAANCCPEGFIDWESVKQAAKPKPPPRFSLKQFLN